MLVVYDELEVLLHHTGALYFLIVFFCSLSDNGTLEVFMDGHSEESADFCVAFGSFYDDQETLFTDLVFQITLTPEDIEDRGVVRTPKDRFT